MRYSERAQPCRLAELHVSRYSRDRKDGERETGEAGWKVDQGHPFRFNPSEKYFMWGNDILWFMLKTLFWLRLLFGKGITGRLYLTPDNRNLKTVI